MDVQRDFLPRVKVQESKDETLSYTGHPDFTPEQPEIRTLSTPVARPRPRTRASMNNSYT